jgi:hypothetical protein
MDIIVGRILAEVRDKGQAHRYHKLAKMWHLGIYKFNGEEVCVLYSTQTQERNDIVREQKILTLLSLSTLCL